MKDSIQATSAIWMVRPAFFGNNSETAASNSFQKNLEVDNAAIYTAALEEFDRMVEALKESEIDVIVTSNNNINTPDAIFPNNWISFHPDGSCVLYPMMAPNRRKEKNIDLLDQVKGHFSLKKIHDLSFFEEQHKFLEGTGSMVFDHQHKIAYAAFSERTNLTVLEYFCSLMQYSPLGFSTKGDNGQPLYHTNVMMHIGESYAIVCSEVIVDLKEREKVIKSLQTGGRTVIQISAEEMKQFAGNMLQVKNKSGDLITIISANAFDALSDDHLELLLEKTILFPIPIPVIEAIGGGSVRCMLAEIFLPRIN